jgi:protein arginine kinase activator
MLCDDCGKNEAVVHIVQIGPNGRVEKNLCEECAAKYSSQLFETPQQRPMSMNDFLKGVFSNAPLPHQAEKEVRPTELVCPNCGMTYRDFQQTGKIGCSVCYDTFRAQLEPLLRRIHGSSVHSGKIPHRSGGKLETKHEIAMLRERLKDVVEKEEYEKAAQYRDQIHALEKKLAQTAPQPRIDAHQRLSGSPAPQASADKPEGGAARHDD